VRAGEGRCARRLRTATAGAGKAADGSGKMRARTVKNSGARQEKECREIGEEIDYFEGGKALTASEKAR
jgi:hypothetical protein